MVEISDPKNHRDNDIFAQWIANAAMGEDSSTEEIKIGYRIEHAISYNERDDPTMMAKNTIIKYKEKCHDIYELLYR